MFSSTAKLLPTIGVLSLEAVDNADTITAANRKNERTLSTTVPIINPTADASMVLPKPIGSLVDLGVFVDSIMCYRVIVTKQ